MWATADDIIELVISDNELRQALLVYARNIFLLSILLSSVTAMLIFLQLNFLLVRPLAAAYCQHAGVFFQPGSIRKRFQGR